MTEREIKEMIATEILAHERRVGFISGAIGTFWLLTNVAVVVYLVLR